MQIAIRRSQDCIDRFRATISNDASSRFFVQDIRQNDQLTRLEECEQFGQVLSVVEADYVLRHLVPMAAPSIEGPPPRGCALPPAFRPPPPPPRHGRGRGSGGEQEEDATIMIVPGVGDF